jgi:hypothetical protein
VAPEASKSLLKSIADIFARHPSAEGLASTAPGLLESSKVISRFAGGSPISSIADSTLERLVQSSRLSIGWKESATIELVNRAAITDDFVSAILRDQSPIGTSWARAAARGLLDRPLTPGLSSRLVTLLTAHPEKGVVRRALARVAVANQLEIDAVDRSVETDDPDARVTTDQVDLAFRADREKTKHLALARSIVASKWAPANNWVEFLATAPEVAQSTLTFVREEYVRAAAEYLAARPLEELNRSDRQLALAVYRKDSTLRLYDPSGFLRIAEDKDLDQLIRESRYEFDLSTRSYLSLAMQKATLTRLSRLLESESSEVVIAALSELARRGRPPSRARLMAMSYDPRGDIRIAAIRMTVANLSNEEVLSLLRKYPDVDGPYYYNVVCILDWLGNGYELAES